MYTAPRHSDAALCTFVFLAQGFEHIRFCVINLTKAHYVTNPNKPMAMLVCEYKRCLFLQRPCNCCQQPIQRRVWAGTANGTSEYVPMRPHGSSLAAYMAQACHGRDLAHEFSDRARGREREPGKSDLVRGRYTRRSRRCRLPAHETPRVAATPYAAGNT